MAQARADQRSLVAIKTKGSYLRAQFARLKSRRGAKKAIVAVAGSMLTAVFYILRDGVTYLDLGADHFCRRRWPPLFRSS